AHPLRDHRDRHCGPPILIFILTKLSIGINFIKVKRKKRPSPFGESRRYAEGADAKAVGPPGRGQRGESSGQPPRRRAVSTERTRSRSGSHRSGRSSTRSSGLLSHHFSSSRREMSPSSNRFFRKRAGSPPTTA